MPRPRTAASRKSAQSLYENDTDSGGDTEYEDQAQPPPQQQALARRLSRKRLSDMNDRESFGEANGRPPLASFNLNDDAAEKRRRRKSMKPPNALVDEEQEPQAGPSSSPAREEGNAPGARGRPSGGAGLQRLQSVAHVPRINVPQADMMSNYEEWMKMATDNKINAANSWNFALIDYFHDMSLLRNTGDNSINFQRASYTLDGCVKIWTSRVDSVGTEAGKLLSNLQNEKSGPDNEDDEDNPDGEATGVAKRKQRESKKATLAKDVTQLQSKKLELEFRVDPLFRKTCADFDEGGAQGLLMNHLSLGVGAESGMRVVFDASDAMGKRSDEDVEVELEPEDDVDLSHIRKEFLPDLDILEDKAICHSLAGFSFGQDAYKFDETIFNRDASHDHDDDDDDHDFGAPDGDMPMDVDGAAAPAPAEEDFFGGDPGGFGEDFGGADMAMGDGDEFGPRDDSVEAGAQQAGQAAGGGRPGAFVPFDPRRAPNERDLVMALAEGDGGTLDYFDQNFMKNWAGPEHWRLRKVVRRQDASEAAKDKPRREKKEAFTIDFLTPAAENLKEVSKELFAPVTRGAGITLPGYTAGKISTATKKRGRKGKHKDDRRDTHTLPDDMHFSSRQLITLFLKPKFSLRMRGKGVAGDDDQEIDENFWAQAAAHQAGGADGEMGDETENGGAIPFNTQFFHEDDDDAGGFNTVFDGTSMANAELEEQDLIAATQGQTRRVRPEFVKYSKKAKRVDVRKLKDNIWKGLDLATAKPRGDENDDDMDETDPVEGKDFSSVVSGLSGVYPQEKMDEISTSFCFICLLHLANERGLKLEVGDDGRVEAADEDEGQEKTPHSRVGDIWGLKVYQDPNATPAA